MNSRNIVAGDIPHYAVRYYREHPKTVEQCESHGDDHRAYGWCAQIDPRWTQEQVDAYLRGKDRKEATTVAG